MCCEPRLIKLVTRGARPPSAKLEFLLEPLEELLAEGRKILLFSQFTSMFALIEDELQRRSIDYAKLTSQTRKRDDAIDQFRHGDAPLFLISLKAGGAGLNFPESDAVIHYDHGGSRLSRRKPPTARIASGSPSRTSSTN